MKIPFLPYYIVPIKAIDKGREQKVIATKQLANILEHNNSLIQHIRSLPRKHWPLAWQQGGKK
jgi:hypothetical protein